MRKQPTLALKQIQVSVNPRKYFDAAEMEELTASVREKGVIQAVIVRTLADGGFSLVAGGRRYKAALAAHDEDYEIPVVVREIDEVEAKQLAIIENIQRADMSPAEEAIAAAASRSVQIAVFVALLHSAPKANTLHPRYGVSPRLCADRLGRRRSAGALIRSWHYANRHHFERPSRHDNAMSNSPTPSSRSIAFTVPTHLAEALQETVDDFLAKAVHGMTPAQRAAEIRAQDRDASLDSLAHLLEVAEGSSGHARIVAQFLAGLYNGDDFPFSLTDFRRLDGDLLEHCLQVLRLDSWHATEVHRYFPDGEARWQTMIQRWGLADEPAHTPLPNDDMVHSCQYDNKLDAPGYRDVTLFVKVAVGVDDVRSLGLALSAADSERLAADLVSVHRLAWARGMPLDADENEPRPAWL